MEFLVTRADVDLHFVVADPAHDVGAEQVAAKFPAGVAIHEADLATGPSQRGFLHRERFSRRIIFSIFRIDHTLRGGITLLARLGTDQRGREIGDGRGSHLAQ